MEVKEESRGYAILSSRTTQEVPFGSKKTAVGVIPADWMICALGSFCEISAGGDLVKEDFSKEMDQRHPFPVFSNALSRSGLYGYSASSKYGPDCITVTARGDVGHAYYRSEKFCAIGRVLVISSKQQQACDLRFVTECINNLIEFALESTGVPQLTAPQIAKYEVPLPPSLGEQEAIAEALSDADALIESLEQLIAKKRQIKQGTMQALLTGQRRLPGFMGEWLTRKFGEVAAIRRDRVDPRKSLEPEFCIELEHIGSGTGSLLGSSDAGSQASLKSVFHAGDVLFGKLRAYLRKYWFADRSGVCSTEIWCLTPKEMLHSKALLFYLVQMDEFIDAASLAYGTHMPRSDWNAVKEFVLRIPQDDEEQAAIATILTDMDTELAELETRLAKTRQLKQGMMQELLTGRIRLVQPALNVVPLPEKKETRAAAASPHNRQINEAVVIAALVKQFGSEDWPLARVRRTKLTYLLHRHAEGRADGFLKKAAGPYDPRTRYKGPEGIALKKGYVQALHNGTYEGFVASEHISDAETYFEKWYGTDVMDWLERFRLRKTDELELLTTVDMAMEDLRREGKPISVEAVRQLIHGHPEWKPKLERAIFSDDGIAAAIAECQALFAS